MSFRFPALLAFFSLVACVADTEANANPGGRQMLKVTYDFRAAGLNVGKATLFAEIEDGKYVATSSMKTAGLAEWFFKSRYRVKATGRVENGDVQPHRYDSDFEGRNSRKLVTMMWDQNGLPGPVAADPPYGARQLKYKVSNEQQREAVDPMSGWIHMLIAASATAESPCGVSIPVFDGRRRYNLQLQYEGMKKLKLERGELFEGQTYFCKMGFEKIAGYKSTAEGAEEGKEDDEDALPVPPLTIWSARLTGEDGFLVPLRMRAETPIGGVIMVAKDIKIFPGRKL